uniref:Uncharacterized protein n=1 Tax=Lactuca sativa TaxID=4236 RepID=A0A9R1VUS1_LACSA|nr:hypothetical protein LSAT_V11C400199640 [Lactuca sativa]
MKQADLARFWVSHRHKRISSVQVLLVMVLLALPPNPLSRKKKKKIKIKTFLTKGVNVSYVKMLSCLNRVEGKMDHFRLKVINGPFHLFNSMWMDPPLPGDDFIVIPIDEIQIDNRLNYVEQPVAVLDSKMKSFCNKVVGLVKVQW